MISQTFLTLSFASEGQAETPTNFIQGISLQPSPTSGKNHEIKAMLADFKNFIAIINIKALGFYSIIIDIDASIGEGDIYII